MIDKKEISKASAKYAKAIWNFDNHKLVCSDGFEAGANWAIQEFLKDLWHPMTEEPVPHGEEKDKICPHVKCIVESKYGEYGVLQWNPIDKCWDDEDFEYDMNWVKRWCYLEDVLPKKDE